MKIPDIKPFDGQHCETTATGTLLNQLGIFLSEPMLFGIGEGIGFIIWNMKNMRIPFIGGRIRPDLLTLNLIRNMNLKMEVQETSSVTKAWKMLQERLDQGLLTGLKLDSYHLDYFSKKFHFAAHYVAMYGYDSEWAYLIDTRQQGGFVKTSLESLARARNEKGPMSSRNRMYTISHGGSPVEIEKIILPAMKRNAGEYLNPPIQNMGYKGIIKTATEIKKWFQDKNKASSYCTLASLMEKAGTGGGLFRNLYRDFIYESSERLGIKELNSVYSAFCVIAGYWTEIASLFDQAGRSGEACYIDEASNLLLELAALEKEAMEATIRIPD